MSRYIDYDAIDYRNDKLYDKSEDFLNGVYYMAERIKEAPSIDIVRCKECIYYGRDSERNTYGCNLHDIGMTPSDFCSYGEE